MSLNVANERLVDASMAITMSMLAWQSPARNGKGRVNVYTHVYHQHFTTKKRRMNQIT